MELLSKTEEMILLAVLKLDGEAYGVTIRKYLAEATGMKFSIGGIYVPLDRLVRKGYLEARQGDPTPERGGMSKRFFTVTRAGNEALAKAKEVQVRLWGDVPSALFG